VLCSVLCPEDVETASPEFGFLSVGFPSKKFSEQATTCLERDFLFKVFAHCNRIDSLEGIVCSQKLSVSLMFLNRQVLVPGHNTNIHCFRKR
jgi:hypothetical protein